MNWNKSRKLMEKYANCPNCGNEYIGNGQGGLQLEEDFLRRWCKCGYDITVSEDGEVLKLKDNRKGQIYEFYRERQSNNENSRYIWA